MNSSRRAIVRTFIAVSALIMQACTSTSSDTSGGTPYAEEVMLRTHEDAMQILAADSGSMERESLILQAHATAHRLSQAGDTAAANLYLRTVKAEVVSAGK